MVFAAVMAFFLLVVSTALAIWWTARQDSRPGSDAIVVLGSAQYNGVPSSIFEARLEHALALYAADVATVICTGGGHRARERGRRGKEDRCPVHRGRGGAGLPGRRRRAARRPARGARRGRHA